VNLIEGRDIMNWWEKSPLVRKGWEVRREIGGRSHLFLRGLGSIDVI